MNWVSIGAAVVAYAYLRMLEAGIWAWIVAGPLILGGIIEIFQRWAAPDTVEVKDNKILVHWRTRTEETVLEAATIRRTVGDVLGSGRTVHLCYGKRRVKLFTDGEGYESLARTLEESPSARQLQA